MIDVRAELEEYSWIRARWTVDKLNAASPFRYDKHPSFFVDLRPESEYYGCWGDSGTGDGGNFVSLIAFLRGETYEEAEEYLAAKYGEISDDSTDDDLITLTVPKLTMDKTVKPTLDESILIPYQYRSPYLASRGISEEIQRMMGVGYDRDRQAIVLPWRLPDATLGNVKFRKVGEKTFWYAKGGRPIREMMYGIDVVYRRRLRKVAIVEAEIDAMTLMTAGIPAIATGGAAFSTAKRDIIVRSPIEEIVVIRDNDAAGRKWQRDVIRELSGYIDVRIAVVPSRYKDVNDFAVSEGGERLRCVISRNSKVSFGKYLVI